MRFEVVVPLEAKRQLWKLPSKVVGQVTAHLNKLAELASFTPPPGMTWDEMLATQSADPCFVLGEYLVTYQVDRLRSVILLLSVARRDGKPLP